MKTAVTLLLVMCLVVATSSNAQVKFSFKAGASLTSVSYDKNINEQVPGSFDYGSRVGFIVGLATEIPFGESKFSLQPELLFHQKGYTSEYADSEYSDEYTTTLNYLEMPVLTRINFGNFYAAAGTYFAVGLGGKYEGTSTALGMTNEWEGKVKFGEMPMGYNGSDNYANTFDFGFVFGGGVKVSAITIDLRYGLGVIDLYDKQEDLDTRTINKSLQLTVGLPIVGKK